METQWPLVFFTLFVCLSAGIFAFLSVLVLRGKAESLRLVAVVVSLVALAVGGIASFLHLEHWDRIFNGFGHLTSGITQELIGVVVLGVLLLIWLLMLFGRRNIPKPLAIVSLLASVAMVVATAHSYMMSARPVWNSLALVLYYLAQAALSGALGIWVIAAIKGEREVVTVAARTTLVSSLVQLVSYAVYLVVLATTSFPDVGYYFDPTNPTKPPVDASDLLGQVLTGNLATVFWVGALILGVGVALVLALVWQRRPSDKDVSLSSALSSTLVMVTLVLTLAGGVAFRHIIYALGFSVFLFY
jgi:anaerobic dimethyl sulfoxide reductase subunit C (anchor subunit)